MSQFGTPSGADAPSITVARAKVVFEPDQDSLDESLREVEKKYQEVIDRVKAAARQAIEEVAADTAQLIDDLKGKLDAAQASASQNDQSSRAEPQSSEAAEQAVRLLTDIREDVIKIEASTSSIDEGVQALLQRE